MYKMYLMGKFPKLKQIMAKCNLNSCKRNILIPLSLNVCIDFIFLLFYVNMFTISLFFHMFSKNPPPLSRRLQVAANDGCLAQSKKVCERSKI